MKFHFPHHKPKYEFVVITDVDENGYGNLYHATDEVYLDQDRNDGYNRKPKHASGKNYMLPVFSLGEIVIVNPDTGREVDGDMRKPSKWCISYKTFRSLDKAVKYSKEIIDAKYGR